jgi:hypothetical protein
MRSNLTMSTTTPRAAAAVFENIPPGSTPLLDHGNEDGMSTDIVSANQLSAEQQLTRFLQWLQFTDRGHLPC